MKTWSIYLTLSNPDWVEKIGSRYDITEKSAEYMNVYGEVALSGVGNDRIILLDSTETILVLELLNQIKAIRHKAVEMTDV